MSDFKKKAQLHKDKVYIAIDYVDSDKPGADKIPVWSLARIEATLDDYTFQVLQDSTQILRTPFW